MSHTLYVMVGLPGAGKTTEAEKWVAADPLVRARSNRDDLRESMFGGWTGDLRHEAAVSAVQHGGIIALLDTGFDVVVDDTNLRADTITVLRLLAEKAGADVVIWDMTHVTVEECIANDNARKARGERHVGEDVIRSKHEKLLNNQTEGNTMTDAATGPDTAHDDAPVLAGLNSFDAFDAADRLAPLPAKVEESTAGRWLRFYAAQALAAHAAARRCLKATPGPESGYLVTIAVAYTAAVVCLAAEGRPRVGRAEVGELLWRLTPELGNLNGGDVDWLAGQLDALGVNPADIYPWFRARDFTSVSRPAPSPTVA